MTNEQRVNFCLEKISLLKDVTKLLTIDIEESGLYRLAKGNLEKLQNLEHEYKELAELLRRQKLP